MQSIYVTQNPQKRTRKLFQLFTTPNRCHHHLEGSIVKSLLPWKAHKIIPRSTRQEAKKLRDLFSEEKLFNFGLKPTKHHISIIFRSIFLFSSPKKLISKSPSAGFNLVCFISIIFIFAKSGNPEGGCSLCVWGCRCVCLLFSELFIFDPQIQPQTSPPKKKKRKPSTPSSIEKLFKLSLEIVRNR